MPYPYSVDIPEIVERAHQHAETLGFPLMPSGRPIGQPAPTTATTPMDGALLRCLASAHPGGTLGEIGTGPGVGTAWLLSGRHHSSRLVSCEIDQTLASSTAQLFRDYANVEIIGGDWTEVLPPLGPYALLFFDGNAQTFLSNRDDWNRLTDLLTIGGQVVMDDLVPIELWPESWKGMTDHKREFCLANPRLKGVEVRTSATTVCVIGTRVI